MRPAAVSQVNPPNTEGLPVDIPEDLSSGGGTGTHCGLMATRVLADMARSPLVAALSRPSSG
jgi:hypothetical protein